jgi:tripartite-type tricarboxylate transporter receptor subunit TctC
MSILRAGAAGLLAAAVFFPSADARAEGFPAQRVTIDVPFAAGSVTDILARILGEETSRRWGQQVIVENRPGIAGTLAVAKAAPDGYTLMLTSNGHTVSRLVNKNLAFDPVKDFAGITRVSSAPLCLIVNPDVPARNLTELIEIARSISPRRVVPARPFSPARCFARQQASISCTFPSRRMKP